MEKQRRRSLSFATPIKPRGTVGRLDIARPDSLVETRRLIRDDRQHRLRPGVAALLGVSRFRRIR